MEFQIQRTSIGGYVCDNAIFNFICAGYYIFPGVCSNEMFDSSARGPGSSLVFSAGSIVCFTMTAAFCYIASTLDKIYYSLASTAGSHVTFLMFAGTSAFACVFTVVFVETKGKRSAEVQLLLSK